jgi:Type II secretion system (T2SS), protein G
MRLAHRIPMDFAAFLALSAVPMITFVAIKLPNLLAAQNDATMWNVAEIRDGLERYRIDNGRCPTTREDLLMIGHVTRCALTDPWGHSIAYRCSDIGAHVRSAGRDGIFNTCDDVAESLPWSAVEAGL